MEHGKLSTSAFLVVTVLLTQSHLPAAVIDFEGLSDLESVTVQFPNLSFSNAAILQAGISLNEIDFPPHSGVKVVSDDSGPMTITFASPVLSLFGYFTYVAPLSIEAFDSADASVALAQSLFSDNDGFAGVAGSSPNELIQVAFAGGISRVVITGDQFGGSFTLDDLTFEEASEVPEPLSRGLVLAPLAWLIAWRRFKD